MSFQEWTKEQDFWKVSTATAFSRVWDRLGAGNPVDQETIAELLTDIVLSMRNEYGD